VEHADRGREAEEDGTFFPEDVSADDDAEETARWASGFDALHAEDNGASGGVDDRGGGSGGRAATTVTELYASLARDAGVRRGRERVFGRTKPRILVCASSNAAVDNLLERVFVRGFTQLDGASAYRPPVVRVGASDAVVAEGVAAVCASTLVEDLIARGEREWDREYRKHDAFQREAAACIRAHEKAHRDAGVEKARRSEAGDALEPCELVRLREEDDARVREMCRLHEDRNKAVADMARLAYLLTHAREKEKGGGAGEGGDAEPRVGSSARSGAALSRRHRVVLEASFVDQAEIVFTTLASSARDVFRRQLTHGFDTVLVDEAAQASETQTLVPFLLGAERCVLVGDPRQLPSTVLSGAAQEAKLQRSLFERFSTLGARIVLLSVQYRMHPEIRRFPSEAFYDGRLEDARSVLDREAADPLFFGTRAAERDGDALSRPYVFFDAASGSASRTGGKTSNVVEAVLVACLYRALAEKLKRRNGDGANANANASRGPRVVAVITPYRQQRVAILDAFAALCGGTGAAARLGVVVSTVDGFQGREADVVIFSAVRGGGGGEGGGGGGASRGVGFLKDVRRVNVALTRAKRALWIVGHAEGLRRSGTIWETLVEDAARRGRVVWNADEREDVLGGATSAGARDDAIRRLEGAFDAPRRFGGGRGGDRGAGGRRRGGMDHEAGWGRGAPPPPPPREARD
jgi:senataxin